MSLSFLNFLLFLKIGSSSGGSGGMYTPLQLQSTKSTLGLTEPPGWYILQSQLVLLGKQNCSWRQQTEVVVKLTQATWKVQQQLR
jgi:hypothetical protein